MYSDDIGAVHWTFLNVRFFTTRQNMCMKKYQCFQMEGTSAKSIVNSIALTFLRGEQENSISPGFSHQTWVGLLGLQAEELATRNETEKMQ